MSPLNIGPDEAQYWRWSTELDWGYYSKPPLIAWMISLTTNLFGHSEWAIRFFAPIGHGLVAFFLFLLGKKAFDVRTGSWAAIIYLLMPAVSLSSNIISTDGLLLPCWTAGITLLWYQRENPTWLKSVTHGSRYWARIHGQIRSSLHRRRNSADNHFGQTNTPVHAFFQRNSHYSFCSDRNDTKYFFGT